MSASCYSGLVPADRAFQNMAIGNSVRAKSAAIARLCALIDNNNVLLTGSIFSDATPVETFTYPNSRSAQGGNIPLSLNNVIYTPVDINLANFDVVFLSSAVPTEITFAVATTTDISVAPTNIPDLTITLSGLTNDVVARGVAGRVVLVPAGSYFTISIASTTVDGFDASWTLEMTQLA